MNKTQKISASLSIHSCEHPRNQIKTLKPDVFLQSFIDLKKKYGEIKEAQSLKFLQKTKEDFPKSPLSLLICQQINIKKRTRHILPPLRNKIGIIPKENRKNETILEKQKEIIQIIRNIKRKSEISLQDAKFYEERLKERRFMSTHEFLNIMLKKGFIH